MSSPTHNDEDPSSHCRQIIGIDFGTTYTSVSYVDIPAGRASESIERNEIKLISGYPGTNYGQREGPSPWCRVSAFEPDYPDDDEVQTFKWGYQVRNLLSQPATHSDPSNLPLQYFKLLLHDGPSTADIRAKLSVTLKTLQERGHVQSELSANYNDSWRREIVLCVPAIWTRKDCREMQTCLAIAMERVDSEGVTVLNNSIQNLFLVSEPEGGADFAGSPEVKADDNFVLLDAGGGTVDANTFRVTSEEPVRLKQEVVAAGGGLYGSRFINEGFREWLRKKLADETYLEREHETIHGNIEQVVVTQFEGHIKRSEDTYDEKLPEVRIVIPGLRHNPNLNFRRGCVIVPRLVLANIFEKCFKGAVYRACNKTNGPERIAQCSYGILTREAYDPDQFPGHRVQEPTMDRYDGERWAPDIMTWIMNKEVNYATVHTLGLFTNGPLTCTQGVFVSDRAKTDHYPINHWRNRGTEKSGEIEVDVSFLRDQGPLTPKPAPVRDGFAVGEDHYEIPLTIRMRVIGQDLECTAIFIDVHGNPREKKCQINIASAFMNDVE
ncbi:Hsp70 chaperone protein [Fusarium bulbicola]|nr:Hsp70 chaperone protein [Fusarium bulbicola]